MGTNLLLVVAATLWGPILSGGEITYTSFRGFTNPEIISMDVNTRITCNLSQNTGYDGEFEWSPDGKRLAFVSSQDGSNRDVYVMDASGGGKRKLTNGRTDSLQPAWSPDGRTLAYVFDVSYEDRDTEIYTLDVETGAIRNISQSSASDFRPVWSPDGRDLAFVSDRDDEFGFDRIESELYVVSADGSGLRRLTRHQAAVSQPAWSPDGRQIAYVSTHAGGSKIYVVEVDSSSLTLTSAQADFRRLTQHTGEEARPMWSPDGRDIAFQAYENQTWELYVIAADGHDLRRLTNNKAGDNIHSWSPDGRYLVFVSNRDGNWELYLMDIESLDVDGTPRVIRLTHDEYTDANPVWRP